MRAGGARRRRAHVRGRGPPLRDRPRQRPARGRRDAVRGDARRRRRCGPSPDSDFPPSALRTHSASGAGADRLRLLPRPPYPHEPPLHVAARRARLRPRGRRAARRSRYAWRDSEPDEWPHTVLLLGDQVYADEVSPDTLEFIRSRRDTSEPPGETISDFEEYTRLYREAWSDPPIRWLLSTVPSAMIFDDHDVIDDWNTSVEWVAEMRATDWWDRRIVGGLHGLCGLPALGQSDARRRWSPTIYGRVRDGRRRRRHPRRGRLQVRTARSRACAGATAATSAARGS